MAKAQAKREVSINLTLTEKEAKFLRDYLQNYLGRPGDEPVEHALIRRDLFNALRQVDEPTLHTPNLAKRTSQDVIIDMVE